MLQRFEGESGRRLRAEALSSQKIVGGNKALAEELANKVTLLAVQRGAVLIEQGASDNDLYLLLSGTFNIVVNGRVVGRRGANEHVGEMAAIEPSQKRSASVIANEDAVVAKLTEPEFAELGAHYPEMFRCIAQELSRRLFQRNAFVNVARQKDLGSSIIQITRERGVETMARLLGEVAECGELGTLPAFSPDRCATAARYFLDLILLPQLIRELNSPRITAVAFMPKKNRNSLSSYGNVPGDKEGSVRNSRTTPSKRSSRCQSERQLSAYCAHYFFSDGPDLRWAKTSLGFEWLGGTAHVHGS